MTEFWTLNQQNKSAINFCSSTVDVLGVVPGSPWWR